MNHDDKRHIVGAIRNNLTHRSPFEPVAGHRFSWQDDTLYRLTDDGGQIPLMAAHEIYGMDDDTLHARAMGGPAPAPVAAFDEESDAEDEVDGDDKEVAESGEEVEKEPEPAPAPKPARKRRSKASE